MLQKGGLTEGRGAHGKHAQQQKQEHEQRQKEGLNMYSKMVNDGWYRVRATYDKPLKYCPYGSAGVVEYMDSLTQAATHFESHMTLSLYEIDMEVPASDATKLLEEVIL